MDHLERATTRPKQVRYQAALCPDINGLLILKHFPMAVCELIRRDLERGSITYETRVALVYLSSFCRNSAGPLYRQQHDAAGQLSRVGLAQFRFRHGLWAGDAGGESGSSFR